MDGLVVKLIGRINLSGSSRTGPYVGLGICWPLCQVTLEHRLYIVLHLGYIVVGMMQ